MSLGSSLRIALRALARNKLQTALTTIGMTIGVATVLTMTALGTGAEAAIEQQVRAAGMNLIVVTAGNYKTKTEDNGGGVVDHQARLDDAIRPLAIAISHPTSARVMMTRATARLAEAPTPRRRQPLAIDVVLAGLHPEDDPMEKH